LSVSRAAADRCASRLPVTSRRRGRIVRGQPVARRIEFADLNMHLEDPGAGLQRRADVLVDGRFGVERPARDAARRIGSEFPRPGIQRFRHTRLVRIHQGWIDPDAKCPQRRGSFGIAGSVGHRPGNAVAFASLVEEAPDSRHHPFRQKVHVNRQVRAIRGRPTRRGRPRHASIPLARRPRARRTSRSASRRARSCRLS
jgi:hypothetical protein